MVIRQRAIQAEDKQERRDAILDAAERMLLRCPDRVANVAEVAEEAALGKGTVYLYFPSKEELLLALHERNVEAFFADVMALVARPKPNVFDGMLALTKRHMVDQPLFLPLASRCFALMAHHVPIDAAEAFRARMSERVMQAGAGIERHFPMLRPGEGARLLQYSFAMIVGLWQMSTASATCVHAHDSTAPAFAWRYEDELARALQALWRGAISAASKPSDGAKGASR
jgi:AcrR family transcriptional regulator